MNIQHETDFLVIGSGIAGLFYSLKVSKYGSVAIVTKRNIEESATKYAQGGIASVTSAEDSYKLHIDDTIEAGAGICDPDIVRIIVENGPGMIRELLELGANFSRLAGKEGSAGFDLSMEGGHSKHRIIHASDLTGLEIERVLIDAVKKNNNIQIFENHIAVDIIKQSKNFSELKQKNGEDVALGCYALDKKSGKIETFLSPSTLLATGGIGKVYLYTSNPDIATGDGIAMAYRAGAKIANMEFIQFHPTCLYHSEAKSFLISEAVRGEGGILKTKDGRTFMENYHSMGCLAPRDVVARAIDFEMKKTGDDFICLDTTHIPGYRIRERFPNLYKKCLDFGIDMSTTPIPIVPAAHYSCGGVKVDSFGKSSVHGLYAAGETACSGVHGANRLASNSLLEALVLSNRAAQSVINDLKNEKPSFQSIPPWDKGNAVDSDEMVVVSHNWDEIRRIMWNYVGVVRSDKRLNRAKRRIEILQEEIKEYYWDFVITNDLIELRNIATVAELVIKSAMSRKESRGLHFNLDIPHRNDKKWKRDTIFENPGEKQISVAIMDMNKGRSN
ncbi:MAG: L-aspartate oxidase [Nitrospinota bacterium]|nr:L-aspartate oxidase [Nitrospinota bacterium]